MEALDTWKRRFGTWITISTYDCRFHPMNAKLCRYKLVREALRERKYFLQTAPHLSMWLPIMLPLDSWWKAPYYWAGTKFYDLLAGSEGIESSYFLTKSKAIDAFPMLKQTDLVGALVYYDGAHND